MKKATINHIYRLIWSTVANCWIAVAENTKSQGKNSGRKLLAAALLASPFAYAAPIGGQVTFGVGAINQSGITTTVSQISQNLSMTWQGFDVAANEVVNFVQPSSTSIAVNRIMSPTGSTILGQINANGQVFLINPNGILFGKGSQINVGGMVASTLDVNDVSLGGNKLTFSGTGTGSIINQGTINAKFAALIGNSVSNEGIIAARMGTVALGAGSEVTLDFSGNNLLRLQVDQSVLNAAASNGGLIQADGGIVFMSAGTKSSILASVVNNTGMIEARTVQNKNGTITLLGGMTAGEVNVSGTLDASAPTGGNGGFIETSAARVNVSPDAVITTSAPFGNYGTYLIDPQNYTIADGYGDISGLSLSALLGTTNVTLSSSSGAVVGAGDLNVNDLVTWNANTILTLNASNDININRDITATGASSGIALNANTANGADVASGVGKLNFNNATINLGGANATASIGGAKYTVINSLGSSGSMTGTDLQGINGNLAGNYVLGSNINAMATATWNAGGGFVSLGSPAVAFTGNFNGLGHVIDGLEINTPLTSYVGLFGIVYSSVNNVGMTNSHITGNKFVGGIAGYSSGTLNNVYTTGTVNGVAANNASVGGIAGQNSGIISNSNSSILVSGGGALGGVAGKNMYGVIFNSYATGNVNGTLDYVGGLVGNNFAGSISNSFATGNIVGRKYVGGLAGAVSYGGSVFNTYSTGNVTGGGFVGGLLGILNVNSTATNSYSSGFVSAIYNVGGLIGLSFGQVSNSFWDLQTSGQLLSAGGFGITTAMLKQSDNFTSATADNGNINPAWDFANVWFMTNGVSTPYLQSFLTPIVISPKSISKVYDGVGFSANTGVNYSTAPNFSKLLGVANYTGVSQGAVNVGDYGISVSGFSSSTNQLGYEITYMPGNLHIAKAPLTYTANPASFFVGETPTGLSGTLSGFVLGDTFAGSTNGVLSWVTPVTATSVAGSYLIDGLGLNAQNYFFVQAPSNSTALTLTSGVVPAVIQSTTTIIANTQQNPVVPINTNMTLQIIGGGVAL